MINYPRRIAVLTYGSFWHIVVLVATRIADNIINMEVSTPKKITARSSICRLCGCSNESCHMLRIFGKSGSDKDICAKVKATCGIHITEDDSCSRLISRKCEAFVFKISDFRQRSQYMQLGTEQPYSVKRCVELLSSSKQPSKQLSTAGTTS